MLPMRFFLNTSRAMIVFDIISHPKNYFHIKVERKNEKILYVLFSLIEFCF